MDDGSKDDTAAIADEYAEKYPTIVKAIHQENGGQWRSCECGNPQCNRFIFKVSGQLMTG